MSPSKEMPAGEYRISAKAMRLKPPMATIRAPWGVMLVAQSRKKARLHTVRATSKIDTWLMAFTMRVTGS